MGVLRNKDSKACVLLNAQHLVGRNELVAHTWIKGQDISKQHATIYWNNGKWYLRDHSRNGTMVNGRHRLRDTVPLKAEDTLQFGRDKSTVWEMINDAPPSSYIKTRNKPVKVATVAARPGIPHLESTGISIFYEGERWHLEKENETIPLTHGTTFQSKGENWEFVFNEVPDETVDYGDILASTFFQFQISLDEENIGVNLVGKDWQIDLGERVHNYMLLALARKRLVDVKDGLKSTDQGWIDLEDLSYEMSKEFRRDIDPYHINLQIHRIRKQLLKSEPYGYLFSNVIERKKGTLRFAHRFLQIMKAGQSFGELLPNR